MQRRFLDLFRQHQLFIIPFLFFLTFAFLIEGIFSKSDLFLLINKHYSPFFDQFFKTITWFGDAVTLLLVGIGLCLVKYRYSVLALVACFYTSLVTQVLKMIFHAKRPIKFFEGEYVIRTVPGCEPHEWNSFPSGHSVSAFTLSIILVHILPYTYRSLVIFPLALLIIFSRVYLVQHFFQDIVVGSILGTILTFQTIWWLENSKWYHSSRLDGRLFQNKR